MYERQRGDDLCNKDKRLKLNWKWSRIASGYTIKQLKSWTHFQCSISSIGDWTLEATQWGYDDNVRYDAIISYQSNIIARSKDYRSRIDAQIAAEKLLLIWLQEQNEKVKEKYQ